MSSSSSASAGHEKYYVPESSSLAVRATIGLILSVFGAALVLNDMTYGSGDETVSALPLRERALFDVAKHEFVVRLHIQARPRVGMPIAEHLCNERLGRERPGWLQIAKASARVARHEKVTWRLEELACGYLVQGTCDACSVGKRRARAPRSRRLESCRGC